MTLEELTRILYPQQDKYRFAAAHLIKAISQSENGLEGHHLNKICNEKSISRATMQKVFVRLRSLGIVDRRQMRYHLNTEFSSALRRISDAWRKITDEKKFDFDDDTIRVNF